MQDPAVTAGASSPGVSSAGDSPGGRARADFLDEAAGVEGGHGVFSLRGRCTVGRLCRTLMCCCPGKREPQYQPLAQETDQ